MRSRVALDLIDDSPGPLEIAVEHGSRPTVEAASHRAHYRTAFRSGASGPKRADDLVNGPHSEATKSLTLRHTRSAILFEPSSRNSQEVELNRIVALALLLIGAATYSFAPPPAVPEIDAGPALTL